MWEKNDDIDLWYRELMHLWNKLESLRSDAHVKHNGKYTIIMQIFANFAQHQIEAVYWTAHAHAQVIIDYIVWRSIYLLGALMSTTKLKFNFSFMETGYKLQFVNKKSNVHECDSSFCQFSKVLQSKICY